MAAFLPTPSLKKCKVFDDVIHNFIRGKYPELKTKNSFVPVENYTPQEDCLDLAPAMLARALT